MSEFTNAAPPEVVGPRPELSKSTEDLETRDDEEHYVVEKICTECNGKYTVNLLKKKFNNRQEAVKSVENKIVCGACLNKDKIRKAAEQMNQR